ncbi:hypothetical protein ACHWQZ_G014479 [Mnemiopsis leidyi]
MQKTMDNSLWVLLIVLLCVRVNSQSSGPPTAAALKRKWRDDLMCGTKYPLSDGNVTECNPLGQSPCCGADGRCGSTSRFCTCDGCVDYRDVNKWQAEGGQKWISGEREKCGSSYPLPDGNATECDPDGKYPCCSNKYKGECGYTALSCSCKDCVDYRDIQKWKEEGEKRWRDDSKCGVDYPLPDGNATECDPNGINPCCDGEGCGNTKDYCSCPGCIDYRDETRWREEGEKRWRDEDFYCGSQYPLPDGSATECNPDSNNPCCRDSHNTEGCGKTLYYCSCNECIDFRTVKDIRSSGRNCSFVDVGGFLKHTCLDEGSKRISFKCPQTETLYEVSMNNKFKLDNFTHVCEEDPHFYQACGFGTKITNNEVFCGGYVRHEEQEGRYSYVECEENCNINRTGDANLTGRNLCDDECDVDICDDESDCGGHQYGKSCLIDGKVVYDPPQALCTQVIESMCGGVNCTITEGTYTCNSSLDYRVMGENLTIPLFNFTRCSVFKYTKDNEMAYPVCINSIDQTNCTDKSRIAGWCLVGGFMSSISKFITCDSDHKPNIPVELCDDGLENECVLLENSDKDNNCKVHKHKMCDGKYDCPDKSDEQHPICGQMTINFTCKRRFYSDDHKKIPLKWLDDGVADCTNGEDENEKNWIVCKTEKFGEVIKESSGAEKCQDYFKCPSGSESGPNSERYVELDQLCDGVESCGMENRVCKVARDFPTIHKSAKQIGTVLDICQSNDDLSRLPCELRPHEKFLGKLDIYGISKTEIVNKVRVPESKVDCSRLFGESYVYLSCLGLCNEVNATCPLNDEKLLHDSCPGQFMDRIYTIVDKSRLTFVRKNDNGQYHYQNYYQCNNGRCIEYKNVCDLIDDCGDLSDEENCTNHMVCKETANKSKKHLIASQQKCDGIYDCFDLSDECNETCGKQILSSLMEKILCWTMGISAVILNFLTLLRGISATRQSRTGRILIIKALVTVISLGDLLIGVYLTVLSVYDSIVYGPDFCSQQAKWLTGTACSALGVISTLGSQLSLFAMTTLSVIRAYRMSQHRVRQTSKVNKRAIISAVLSVTAVFLVSLAVAVVPLVPSFEDYFVQAMYYDPNYKVFIGFPNKARHIDILNTYINSGENITRDMAWKEIGENVDKMFTQQYGKIGRKTVHFYGNDGNCLFKFFVRSDDARRSRASDSQTNITDIKGNFIVWFILAVNLACFISIVLCYLFIHAVNKKSAQKAASSQSPAAKKRNREMSSRISFIIGTDFLCWVPFIVISALHNLNAIDATHWYATLAMVVIPLNSVINPIIYDNDLSKAVSKKLKQIDLMIHSILDQDGNLVNYIHDKLLSRTENTTNNDVEMTQTPTLHEAETENDIEDAESCKMLK